MMKEKEIMWVKDSAKICQTVYVCSCGETMNKIGSAGCPHENNWTYFYQCENCKTVRTAEWALPAPSTQELEEAGWKQDPLLK